MKIRLIILLFMLMGCKTNEIPINNTHIIERRDSIVHLHDTLYIEVPRVEIRAFKEVYDTSIINTDIVTSIAYVDTALNKLYHSVNQHGEIKCIYDTVIVTEYANIVIEKEIPIIKEKKIIDYRLMFWLFVLMLISLKITRKG